MEQSILAKRYRMDQRPALNEGLRPRRGKVRCLLHHIVLEENVTRPNQKKRNSKGNLCFGVPFLKVGYGN